MEEVARFGGLFGIGGSKKKPAEPEPMDPEGWSVYLFQGQLGDNPGDAFLIKREGKQFVHTWDRYFGDTITVNIYVRSPGGEQLRFPRDPRLLEVIPTARPGLYVFKFTNPAKKIEAKIEHVVTYNAYKERLSRCVVTLFDKTDEV